MFEGNIFYEDLAVAAASYIKKSRTYIVGNKMAFDFYKYVLAVIKETLLSSISNLFQLHIQYVLLGKAHIENAM